MHTDLGIFTQSYGAHCIDETDIKAVTAVLQSSHLTCGAAIETFEADLAQTIRAKYAIACSNGTTALHLASVALGLGQDDYVIVPTITFLATANAARYCGANVVFCDVDAQSALVTYDALLASINRCPKIPKLVYLVDIAGQPSCSAEIKSLCDELGIKIIQDASHALGTTFSHSAEKYFVGDNKYADLTTFSFHPVKNITTGEGGAITTNDAVLYNKIKLLRSHGMLRQPEVNPWYYEMHEIGFNYRLTDIQAALGSNQLKKLSMFKSHRAKLKQAYDRLLEKHLDYAQPLKVVENSDPCWHLYIVLIDFAKLKISRAAVMGGLSERGVGSQVHYIPVHSQPYYAALSPDLKLPGSEEYYSKTLSLPLHMHLAEEHIEYIVKSLLEVIKK